MVHSDQGYNNANSQDSFIAQVVHRSIRVNSGDTVGEQSQEEETGIAYSSSTKFLD